MRDIEQVLELVMEGVNGMEGVKDVVRIGEEVMIVMGDGTAFEINVTKHLIGL